MNWMNLKFLLLFQNFEFIAGRIPKRQVPLWIIAEINSNKNSQKQSNFQTASTTSVSLSPWPETSSTAYISTTFSTFSTTESQSVTTQYELTTDYIEYHGNQLISADEKQNNDFDFGFNQEQFSNSTSGENRIGLNFEPFVSFVIIFIMLTH